MRDGQLTHSRRMLIALLAVAMTVWLAACASRTASPPTTVPPPPSQAGALIVRPAASLQPTVEPDTTSGPAELAAATAPHALRAAEPQPVHQSAATAQPAPSSATLVIDYAPQRPSGEARVGACWTNALSVPNRQAWRCNVGSQVLDPCFPLADGQHVVCQPNPLTGAAGILVRLTERLPQPDAIISRGDAAWLVELEDRTICRLATGATGMVGDRRISYVCAATGLKANENLVILGDLRGGPTWVADVATIALDQGKLAVRQAAAVPLVAIVRGPARFAPARCDALAQDMTALSGLAAGQAIVPFGDPFSGESGRGCQVRVLGRSAVLFQPLDALLRKMLALQGWQEERSYRSSAVQESAAAFRQGNILCLLHASWMAAEGASCSTCQSAPEQQIYAIELTCAQDRSMPGVDLPAPQPQRIEFATGATAAALPLRIASGEIRSLVLRAFQGQTMLVEARSLRGDAALTVWGPDAAAPLPPATARLDRWQGQLPATQDYLVRVAGRGQDADVTLTVVIPADLALPPASQTTAMRSGLTPGETMYYLLAGEAGQTVTLTVTSPAQNVFMELGGLEDGQALVTASERASRWTGSLPATQRYLLRVSSDAAPTTISYTVQVAR